MDSRELAELFAAHWEWELAWSPTWATTLGDHRYDNQLPRRDALSIERHQDERHVFLERARRIDSSALSSGDRVSLAVLVTELSAQVARRVCREHEWLISARENPFTSLSYNLGERHVVKTLADGRNLLARLAQAPRAIDEAIANLRSGLASGRVASQESLRRTAAQLDQALAKPTEEWAFSLPAKVQHPDWEAADQRNFSSDVRRAVEERIRPAVTRLRDAVRDELLPRGRTGAQEGLSGLFDGVACYRAMILSSLGSARDPDELHRLGTSQIERSDREITALGQRLFRTSGLRATSARVRADRALFFNSGEEIQRAAESAIQRAEPALLRWFRRLPKSKCLVREVPAHEAPYTTTAYYRPPHYDGTKPGEFFVNTFKPETRSRVELAALTYHESIPGHHLQLGLAQELGALPLMRKLRGSTAFIEGWALYTERLADEMGLYDGDLSRLGMWSFDAWRSARLVVDTGVHALGWTRERAERYLLEHTALSPDNVSNEVDRYISTPGQALAYKVGQLEILELRALAEKALAKNFDVRDFHEVVLEAGAVPLPVLRERVTAWITSRAH